MAEHAAAIECILRLSSAKKKNEKTLKKNKHRCESSKWCSFIASALARNVQENNLPGINERFLHTPELEKAEEERKKKSKITHDSTCPAHPKALRRGSALLLAECRRPGSLCFCVSVFSRSLLHSPRLDPRVQPTTSRLQDPVRSADGGLCGAPPLPSSTLSPPPPPPPPCRRRREDSVFRVGTSWEKEEITGGCWAAVQPDGLN